MVFETLVPLKEVHEGVKDDSRGKRPSTNRTEVNVEWQVVYDKVWHSLVDCLNEHMSVWHEKDSFWKIIT